MFSMADPCDFFLENHSELISKEYLLIGLKITSIISLTSQQANTESANTEPANTEPANTESANIVLTFVFVLLTLLGQSVSRKFCK